MAVNLYMDVHVPRPITDQLRIRDVDVLTAQEDKAEHLPDGELLERASFLDRVIFTQDIRFKAMAESWQRDGRQFGGLIFGHQLRPEMLRVWCVPFSRPNVPQPAVKKQKTRPDPNGTTGLAKRVTATIPRTAQFEPGANPGIRQRPQPIPAPHCMRHTVTIRLLES